MPKKRLGKDKSGYYNDCQWEEPYEICEVIGDEEVNFNYEEDERLDLITYGFFKNFIKSHENTSIAAKIELMLNKIMAKSEKTGKDIFTNKMKNERLHYYRECKIF